MPLIVGGIESILVFSAIPRIGLRSMTFSLVVQGMPWQADDSIPRAIPRIALMIFG